MAFGQAQLRRVLYPQDGCSTSGVLSLAPGDVLEVEQADREWWTGKIVTSGNKTPPLQTGFFYSKFTVPVEPNKPPAVPCLPMNMGNPPAAEHSVTYKENDYISESPPSNEMMCMICHNLASGPHQTMCCGQTVCLTCAETWKRTNNSCPQCRRAPLHLSVDVHLERTVANLYVHCVNHSEGCDWTGHLGDATSHLKMNCPFASVMEECEHRGCSMKMLGRDLKEHMVSECKQRAMQCPCCKERKVYYAEQGKPARFRFLFGSKTVLTYNLLITEHYKVCPDWPMRCPNKCPQNNLTRASGRSLQAHLDEDCPGQVISCQFSEAGCGVRVKRREMEEHLQKAMGQHMAGMMKDCISMKKELIQSTEDYRNVAKELTQCKDDSRAVTKTLSAVNEELKAVQKKLSSANEELKAVQNKPLSDADHEHSSEAYGQRPSPAYGTMLWPHLTPEPRLGHSSYVQQPSPAYGTMPWPHLTPEPRLGHSSYGQRPSPPQ